MFYFSYAEFLTYHAVRYYSDCFADILCSLVSTALHGMQTRYSDEKAVRLSVRQTREL